MVGQRVGARGDAIFDARSSILGLGRACGVLGGALGSLWRAWRRLLELLGSPWVVLRMCFERAGSETAKNLIIYDESETRLSLLYAAVRCCTLLYAKGRRRMHPPL